ncbi:MAG TPA: hypothetical protein VNI78_07060, partial [Vicinamibacterales bacterium]|nr:hypothetical protein [Vicinamibacterales bacterium]
MRSLMRVAIALVAVVLVGAGNPRPLGGGAGSAPLPVQRAVESRAPALPKVRVAVPAITATRTVHVPAGGDLQAALDRAQGGELITLEPGATYRGPFTLRRKSRAAWITIASASPELPGPGERVTPAHRHLMPRLASSSDAVVIAEPGAHHYRLVGLEIAPEPGVFLQTLVRFGEDERSVGDLPHHLVVDRSYLHGDPRRGGRRGVALNARHAAVIGSYLTDFKEEGADSQAIAGWNGDGPFLVANNYLEAAGENVMFGGADPAIAGLVPADIEITGNYVTKPLRWKKDDPAFEGPEWAVKNLFELKNARRVRVAGNVFEHNWPHAQNGFAILFTVRNQDGGAPWSVVEDVTFENNLVRHVGGGINILGRDDNHRSQQTRRIAIRNNIFLDVGGAWGPGRLFQLLDGTAAVRIDHNTALQTGTLLTGGDKAPHTGFVFENNIARHNEYGITGSGVRAGRDALARYFPGASVRRNVIVGGAPHEYPADNFFPSSLDEIGEIDLAPRFRLLLAPGYVRAGTDGCDPGADIDAVRQAIGPLATVGLRAREAAAAA